MSKVPTEPAPAPATPPSPSRGSRELRDTIESVVFAFVLAFLFRTFEAEAFVIPTGSMAPTLYGRHKETHCAHCGYRVVVGASEEVEQDSRRDARGRLQTISGLYTGRFVSAAYCPNCRGKNPFTEADPVFNGDRILVNKYPYEFSEPDRWDVFVFKYPEQPGTNYIKRLVGLPNETLRIIQGDVYQSQADGDQERLRILRKEDPSKQRALQMVVHDDRHPASRLLELGWPERWSAMNRDDSAGGVAGWFETEAGWRREEDRGFRLSLDRSAPDTQWIRYRHFVPTPADWDAVERDNAADLRPEARLITDFCGYNAYTGGRRDNQPELGLYWVGDLTVNCIVRIEEVGEGGELVFELNEGIRAYRCHIDANTGRATLTYTENGDPVETELAQASTGISGAGTYSISFANVDNGLRLWVDGDPVYFGAAARYEPPGGTGALQSPTNRDLSPVGIGATRLAARVSQLVLERDFYYRNDLRSPRFDYSDTYNALVNIEEYEGSYSDLQRLETDPSAWFRQYVENISTEKTGTGEKYEGIDFRFRLGPDEFFGMGDNSPASQDSRLWPNDRLALHRYAIPRNALVGKAFFIYWPHGVPFLNNGRGYPDGPDSIFNISLVRRFFYHKKPGPQRTEIEDNYPEFRVPFYPNIRRMERIR